MITGGHLMSTVIPVLAIIPGPGGWSGGGEAVGARLEGGGAGEGRLCRGEGHGRPE
jgi:hypothetical protein